jgi:hypothetical protein
MMARAATISYYFNDRRSIIFAGRAGINPENEPGA